MKTLAIFVISVCLSCVAFAGPAPHKKFSADLINELNLDEERAAQLKQVMKEGHEARKEIHERARAEMKELHHAQRAKMAEFLSEEELAVLDAKMKEKHKMKKKHHKKKKDK
jgi:Spy/CpxP family protein refolding chaperone